MKKYTIRSFIQMTATAGMALALLSSCGGVTPANYSMGSSSSNAPTTLPNFQFDNSGSSNGSTTTIPTGTNPAYVFNITGVGYTSLTVNVSTGTVLRLNFTPGIQSTTISGTGAAPQYSQLGVYFTVNGTTQTSGMLSNGMYGGTAQSSGVIDFSSAISSACGSNTSCRQTVSIIIDHPNYDYWCLNFGMACPWNHVSSGHPWNGTLTVQTDDTVGI